MLQQGLFAMTWSLFSLLTGHIYTYILDQFIEVYELLEGSKSVIILKDRQLGTTNLAFDYGQPLGPVLERPTVASFNADIFLLQCTKNINNFMVILPPNPPAIENTIIREALYGIT